MQYTERLIQPLTQKELEALADALTNDDWYIDSGMFRAFLFICETGLSWEDVNLLKWTQIDRDKGLLIHDYDRLGGQPAMKLSELALSYLPAQESDKVFPNLYLGGVTKRRDARCNIDLYIWAKKAKLKRDFGYYAALTTFVDQKRSMLIGDKEIADRMNITEHDISPLFWIPRQN